MRCIGTHTHEKPRGRRQASQSPRYGREEEPNRSDSRCNMTPIRAFRFQPLETVCTYSPPHNSYPPPLSTMTKTSNTDRYHIRLSWRRRLLLASSTRRICRLLLPKQHLLRSGRGSQRILVFSHSRRARDVGGLNPRGSHFPPLLAHLTRRRRFTNQSLETHDSSFILSISLSPRSNGVPGYIKLFI